jgi:glycosyltransferase involved in cell wall biosynthesis
VAHVDVFSGQAFFLAEAACWVLRQRGCPYILTLRGGNLPAFAQKSPGRVGKLLRSAVVVTAPSGYLVDALREYRSDIVLLPNAIDITIYPHRFRPVAAPRLIWVRSFHRIYNPVMAPHVVAELASHFPDIHLTMVGPDKDGSLAETRAEAEKLGVSSHIEFIAGVPKAEVPGYLDRGDVFLNTTNIDNMPVTVAEAMACGLCVVSTDAGGVPYLVKDGVNGMLVPARDPKRMAAAIARVLSEPQLASTISAGARHQAEQFDWSNVLPQWQNLFARTRECVQWTG